MWCGGSSPSSPNSTAGTGLCNLHMPLSTSWEKSHGWTFNTILTSLIYLGLPKKKRSQLSTTSNHLNQYFPDCATSHICPLGYKAQARDATWPSLFCCFWVPQKNSLLHYKAQRKIFTAIYSVYMSSIRQTFCILYTLRMECTEHPNMSNILQVAAYTEKLPLTLILFCSSL